MIRVRLHDSIDELEPAQWDALLAGRSITFSHAFWRIIEQSQLNDFHYRHLLFVDDDEQPVGLATFYRVTTDIAIFAPPWLRRALGAVRRMFPNFLKLRMLECGTPIILNSPPALLHPDLPADEVIEVLHRTLMRHARDEGVLLLVLRDFERNAQPWLGPLRRQGYHLVDGLPNSYLDIRWRDVADYRAALKSYYRSKINNHLRKNAELQVWHDLIDDFAPLADALCRQWLTVHARANEFQREVLTPAFYRELALRLDGRAKVLRLFRERDWIGHALLLHDGDTLRWLYFGRDEPVNDSLYLYVTQAVIQTAIELGVARLELGLTTYPIKQDAGARLEPIQFAVRCRWGLFNPLVGRLYGLFNKPARIQDKQVFKAGQEPQP